MAEIGVRGRDDMPVLLYSGLVKALRAVPRHSELLSGEIQSTEKVSSEAAAAEDDLAQKVPEPSGTVLSEREKEARRELSKL